MNLIFPYIGNNDPNWLIFLRGLKPPTSIFIYIYMYIYIHTYTYKHVHIYIHMYMLLDYSNAGCEWRLINQKREETRKPRYGLGGWRLPIIGGSNLTCFILWGRSSEWLLVVRWQQSKNMGKTGDLCILMDILAFMVLHQNSDVVRWTVGTKKANLQVLRPAQARRPLTTPSGWLSPRLLGCGTCVKEVQYAPYNTCHGFWWLSFWEPRQSFH